MTETRYIVQVGDDGRVHYSGSDLSVARNTALRLSIDSWLGQARIKSTTDYRVEWFHNGTADRLFFTYPEGNIMSDTETTTKAPKAPKASAPCQCLSIVQYTLGPDDESGFDHGYTVETPVYGPCEAVTKGDFAQGHDAKLKSVLINLNRAGLPYLIVQGGMLIDKDPQAVAADRGWSKFLTPAKPKKVREPKAEKSEATEDRMATLELMKQAAAELKARGQYGSRSKDRIQVTADNAQAIVDGTHPDLRPRKDAK